jgi:hypothetical protein
MDRSIDGMKLHTEKYSEDYIPCNLPESFQGCEKLEKIYLIANLWISTTQTECANCYTTQTFLSMQFSRRIPMFHKIQ